MALSSDIISSWLTGSDGNFDLPASLQPGSASASERLSRGLPMTARPLTQAQRLRRRADTVRQTVQRPRR